MSSLDTLARHLAIDCAHTFKNLYKQSDIKEKYTNILVFVPLVASIVILVYADSILPEVTRWISTASLVFSILLLVGNKSSENIMEYRRLANEYKSLYDQLHFQCSSGEIDKEKIELIIKAKEELGIRTAHYPIGFLARTWSKLVIYREMNLGWTKENA